MSENGKENGAHDNVENRERREKKPPEWTIMIYLAGDNNLTSYCISVLQQLEAANHSEDVRVLACFDSNIPWVKGARYLEIKGKRGLGKTGFSWPMHNDLLVPYSKRPVVGPAFCNGKEFEDRSEPEKDDQRSRPIVAEGLKRFINWSMKEYEDSKRFMLVLFGHGPLVAGQTFLVQENPPSSVRLEDLQKVLNKHFGPDKRRLDILACQNCVMNGVETAFEIKDQVDFMIGSQGLVLATGWPYEKIINAVVKEPHLDSEKIAGKIVKECARSLLDFSLMDRSSEQSVCNLKRLRKDDENGKEDESITEAMNGLVDTLISGLGFKANEDGEMVLKSPEICDAVRLARLEAQSYWGETFVDLYDFCERLLKKCNETMLSRDNLLQELKCDEAQAAFPSTQLYQQLDKIIGCCVKVMHSIKKLIRSSYYIGSDLQYSHGLSIYFPWTLPTGPYFFIRMSQGRDYWLKTAFEAYREYSFAQSCRWAEFLESFFKATLRKVRRVERDFVPKSINPAATDKWHGLVFESFEGLDEVITIDLQKSGPDSGDANPDIWSNVKNYPRRNYLSPSDCGKRIEDAGIQTISSPKFPKRESPPVSYLGWNVQGLIADLILEQQKLPPTAPASIAPQSESTAAAPDATPAGVSAPPSTGK